LIISKSKSHNISFLICDANLRIKDENLKKSAEDAI
jgi:hypothetical protein